MILITYTVANQKETKEKTIFTTDERPFSDFLVILLCIKKSYFSS